MYVWKVVQGSKGPLFGNGVTSPSSIENKAAIASILLRDNIWHGNISGVQVEIFDNVDPFNVHDDSDDVLDNDDTLHDEMKTFDFDNFDERIVTEYDLRRAEHHVLISRKHKILFASIPKVSCTEWMKLFFRLEGYSNWHIYPHWRADNHQILFSKASVEEANLIMHDPEWQKITFFRDPARRLLSAYLDKFVFKRSYSSKIYGLDTKLSFEEFVDIVSDNESENEQYGLKWNTNAHWRPQRYMNSFEKFLPFYQHIGSMENISSHSKAILKKIGIWDEFGAKDWGQVEVKYIIERDKNNGSLTMILVDRHIKNPDEVFTPTNMSFLQENKADHNTNSNDAFYKYYTKENDLLGRVKKLYEMDYEMLNAIGLNEAHVVDGRGWIEYEKANGATAWMPQLRDPKKISLQGRSSPKPKETIHNIDLEQVQKILASDIVTDPEKENISKKRKKYLL